MNTFFYVEYTILETEYLCVHFLSFRTFLIYNIQACPPWASSSAAFKLMCRAPLTATEHDQGDTETEVNFYSEDVVSKRGYNYSNGNWQLKFIGWGKI